MIPQRLKIFLTELYLQNNSYLNMRSHKTPKNYSIDGDQNTATEFNAFNRDKYAMCFQRLWKYSAGIKKGVNS